MARQVKLERESELRVEVGPDAPLRLRILTGSAEIFGTEISSVNRLSFPPRLRFAVFTWVGAIMELNGATITEHIAQKTPMSSYYDVHMMLETRRAHAAAKASPTYQGPRVIVVGPIDSGKSTLCKMILSWATKQGWKPTYVDVNIGQASIIIPGCISATPVENPIDPIEGIHFESPLVYFYGHTSPSVNAGLYKVLVHELSINLERCFAKNSESRAAGMIIDTMGWIKGLGYELLLHAIETLNANTILVLGEEDLYSTLKDLLTNKPNIDVVSLKKSDGVLSRNSSARMKTRSNKIREYFYGIQNELRAHYIIASFSDLLVFKIRRGPQGSLTLVGVKININLLHSVLGISFAKEPNQIISSKVAGFIYIADIDMQSEKITYLAPSAGELPSRFLIMGSLTWLEI